MSIAPGQSVHMAGFGDSRAVIDSSNISLSLSGPTGTSPFRNDTTLRFPVSGTYTLTAVCGNAPSEHAFIVVQGTDCPYASVQVRVQPNVQTPWTPTLVINHGARFHVGALFNGTGFFAPSGIHLTVTDANGVISSPPNGAFVPAPVPGFYFVTGTCSAMVLETATVYAQ
jgi:hypothetical protein